LKTTRRKQRHRLNGSWEYLPLSFIQSGREKPPDVCIRRRCGLFQYILPVSRKQPVSERISQLHCVPFSPHRLTVSRYPSSASVQAQASSGSYFVAGSAAATMLRSSDRPPICPAAIGGSARLP